MANAESFLGVSETEAVVVTESFFISLKTKTARKMLKQFKNYQAIVKKQLKRKIKRIKTDEEEEYKEQFEKYLRQQRIIHEITASYSFDQNEVAERINRTIMKRTRLILVDMKLSKEL